MSSHIDNILIQVRSLLNQNSIKLWLEPYYVEGIGTIDSEMERLAKEFSRTLSIRYDYCLAAINELQSSALEKLQARKEFQETGLATLKVRTVRQGNGVSLFTIKIQLNSGGRELQHEVAKELKINQDHVKLISSGKVIKPDQTLVEQGINNNQQLMAVIIETTDTTELEIYERVKKIKADASLLTDSGKESFLRMEDQDGNAVHLPPNERRALTVALALQAKGRAALKRENYNEALILFLEADQEFASCNSKILEAVDNYGLLNLDIVWCYLCLKSLTQLPDAQRRLYVCEESFRRSYGDNMDRVVALKGSSENEKTLMMRLHLLQAVLMFHQNRRNESQGLLMLAESELRSLKVDEASVAALTDMGYGTAESRVALRACGGQIDQAVAYIIEKRESKRNARRRASEELDLNNQLPNDGGNDDWVNPRTLHSLIGMGFQKELAIVALRKSKNDLTAAVDMLQHNSNELIKEVPTEVNANEDLIDQITKLGFEPDVVRLALEQSVNDINRAVEILLKMQNDGTYDDALVSLLENMPSTSTEARKRQTEAVAKVKKDVKSYKEKLEAYNRFAEDVSNEDEEHLDMSLVREENVLLEYKRFLE